MNLTLTQSRSHHRRIARHRRSYGAVFVAAGAKVIFNYQAAKAQADDLVRECGAENCRAVQSDLSTTTAAQHLLESAISAFGRLDILVANHGIWPPEDVPVDRMADDHGIAPSP